jgi:hypothetical protein
MMKPYVFVGPSLRPAEARQLLSADYRGPIQQGDIFRAVNAGANAIGIIDGYFQLVPAIWHKEILWALERGVKVFGSSSMGALRAVELADFGMVGIGEIFELFKQGILEDDDEVAVLHGPQELDYVCLSEPMVSIRATIHRGIKVGCVSSDVGLRLIKIAKNLFYQERTYEAIFTSAIHEQISEDEITKFIKWVPEGRVDLKGNDARLLLRRMAREAEELTAVLLPRFKLNETVFMRLGMLQAPQARTKNPAAD